MKQERKLFTLLTLTVLCALILGLFPVSGEEAVYDRVLRLHVLANSDSEEDQALKLKVRDRILSVTSEMFEAAKTKEEAADIAEGALDIIRLEAEKTVAENGYDYPVSVKLGQEQYPRRSYDGLQFPAGEYLSLKVNIGEAEGENWWCVLFPPICLGAAARESTEDSFIEAGLTGEQYKVITESDGGRYKVKFKILEIFKQIFG